MVWGVLHVVSRRWMVECIHWRPFFLLFLISVFFELLLFSLQPSRNTDLWPSGRRSTGCNPGIQSLCAQLGCNRTVASTVLNRTARPGRIRRTMDQGRHTGNERRKGKTTGTVSTLGGQAGWPSDRVGEAGYETTTSGNQPVQKTGR